MLVTRNGSCSAVSLVPVGAMYMGVRVYSSAHKDKFYRDKVALRGSLRERPEFNPQGTCREIKRVTRPDADRAKAGCLVVADSADQVSVFGERRRHAQEVHGTTGLIQNTQTKYGLTSLVRGGNPHVLHSHAAVVIRKLVCSHGHSSDECGRQGN